MSNTSFLMALKSCFAHVSTWWNLWFPLIMLAAFCLILFVLVAIRASRKPEDGKKTTLVHKILGSCYWSGMITLALTTFTVIALMKFTVFFPTHYCQFGVVMGFLLVCVLTMLGFAAMCKKVKVKDVLVTDVPISDTAMGVKYRALKRRLRIHMWLFVFVVGWPFLFLLVQTHRDSLVSIVLDNSVSMSQYLDYGKNSLESVLAEDHQDAEYLFTSLKSLGNKTFDGPDDYFKKTVATKQPNGLSATTTPYTDSRSLINDFTQVDEIETTPLFQGIWQNFLVARDEANSKSFSKKKLIIVSDGEDITYVYERNTNTSWSHENIFQQKGNLNESPEDFFDGIYAINLGGEEDYGLWRDGAASIDYFYDGTDQQSYYDALVEILPEMFFDWFLILYMAGLLIISFVVLLISRSTVA